MGQTEEVGPAASLRISQAASLWLEMRERHDTAARLGHESDVGLYSRQLDHLAAGMASMRARTVTDIAHKARMADRYADDDIGLDLARSLVADVIAVAECRP